MDKINCEKRIDRQLYLLNLVPRAWASMEVHIHYVRVYHKILRDTIGSESIGRNFRGGFCKFGLCPGITEQYIVVINVNQVNLSR
ncbi:hypothetical protein LOAG_12233 [Loa loa]|uniref:Uncharacterized protein n=1 Tax=Loa loa TaxID=7209 RepID=A0A1S0TLP0_LOALO|nr:hypothetical protein LOAG_12233 [Loa loa]EFO16273.1 hypothetical protein LOAG_12233 [Loa loa]